MSRLFLLLKKGNVYYLLRLLAVLNDLRLVKEGTLGKRVINGNQISGGEHRVVHTDVDLKDCSPETYYT